MDMLNNDIILAKVSLIDGLVFLRRISFGQENLYWHERAVFLKNFSHSIFICKFQAVFVQEQSDFCTDLCSVAVRNFILCAAVRFPVNSLRTFFIRKGIDVNFIGYHKCRVEAKTKVTDHLVIRRFIFVFFQELCSAGESNLCDIFFYFVRSHTDTVIDKLQSFLFWVYDYTNHWLVIIREIVLAHNFQFFQFCDRIASVGDHLTCENVMIGIKPFFNNWKNVVTVNR